MCGLVAFSGHEPDPGLLLHLADEAERRGPHGWGAAWVECDELLTVYGSGRLSWARETIGVLPGPLILHARLATSGIAAEQSEVVAAQPLRVGRVALGHNGTVPNYADLLDTWRIEPATAIDSEVVAWLVDRFLVSGAPLDEALGQALSLIPHAPHAAVILDQRGRMAVARFPAVGGPGHPLWWAQRPEGTYVCSRRPGPGWEEVPDDSYWPVPAGVAA